MASTATGISTSFRLQFAFPSNSRILASRQPVIQRTKPKRAPTVPNNDIILNKRSASEEGRLALRDYLEQSGQLFAKSDGGPPRWFSPLECGSQSRLNDAPLLLFLPGVDGGGLGLMLHHERLGFLMYGAFTYQSRTERHLQVESAVRVEHSRNPKRPIYLVGESFGGCLALAVAARNQDVDLILILANPATSFSKSQVLPQTLLPLSAIMPEQLRSSIPYALSLLSGSPLKIVSETLGKGLPLGQAVVEISQDSMKMLSHLTVLSDVLTVETLTWKLNLVKSGAAFANSRLHAVEAQTLVLVSGQDQLLPSREEGERLCRLLPNCDMRTFDDSGHALFLDEGISLASILIGASFYRRGRSHDHVFDYFPPTPLEFKRVYQPQRWIELVTDPVMLSTLESGEIVRDLSGIPSEGPVLLVGYHMMLGLELTPLVAGFWTEKNILLRGIAHPMMFTKLREGLLPSLSSYDTVRVMGAVPASASNFYKLFSSRSHVLLYPGGMREALHRKGEEYKLFWPEQSEFVRMAARFGAKIVPFGSVGEDDIGHLLLDYNDLREIPYFKAAIGELTDEAVKLRGDAVGEVANQDVHLPIILPKIPGRFYYYFGKPIQTEGRKEELKSREKAHGLYLEVKAEVEKCLDYLKEKRENDPYRNVFGRLNYKTTHGFNTQVPTFDF